MPLQLRVLGAFFPELVRAVIEEEMTEHGLSIDDLREAERKAEARSRSIDYRSLADFFFSAAGLYRMNGIA